MMKAASGSFPCPPTNGQAYQPANPLSAFDGEEVNGTWTLSIQDVYGPSDGGSLNGWGLEIEYSCPSVPFSCGSGLLTNPDFESGTTGWNFEPNTTITSDAYFGSQAAHASGGVGGVGQNYAATAGQAYTLSVYAKQVAPEGASVALKFFDASFTELGSAYYYDVTSTNYELYSLSAFAPTGTAWVQALGWKNSGSGEAFWDGFCLEQWGIIPETCTGSECNVTPSWGNYVFALDDSGAQNNWLMYDNAGLVFCDNGDGTFSLKGNVFNGRDSDWDAILNVPCGGQDGWVLDLLLSDMQSWTDFQGSYVQTTGCGANHVDWDYWDISGTVTGIGCNVGRSITVNGPSNGYRMQIGSGGNSQSCNFGLSTWFSGTEGGNSINMDIYAHLDSVCYYSLRPHSATCENVVTNKEFNSGTSDWFLYQQSGNTAALSTDTNFELSGINSAYVDITTATGINWHIQLTQPGHSIEAGKNYNITFDAKAVANRTVSVALQRTNAPYSTYYWQDVSITTTATTYSYDFQVDSTNAGQVGLYFNIGHSTDNVWIDNVSFSEICTTEICGNGIDDDGDGLADCLDPDCNSELDNLKSVDFSMAGILESGIALSEGAVYRYSGVAANTDALVTIEKLSNGSLDASSFTANVGIFVDLFGNTGTIIDPYIDFQVDFVQAGTATPISVPFDVIFTFFDIDHTNWSSASEHIYDEVTFFDIKNYTTSTLPNYSTTQLAQGDYSFKNSSGTDDPTAIDPDFGVAIVYDDIISFNYRWGFDKNVAGFGDPRGGILVGDQSQLSYYINIDCYTPEICGNGIDDDGDGLTDSADPDCASACALTNPFPGFPIDFLNDNTGWLDYDLGSDMVIVDNGDGTKTITGSIDNGTPVDFGSGMNGTSCGATDGWSINLVLSDKMDWTTFQAAGGSANVHANCNAQIANLEYWDISGTLTGTGCNAGRTLTITGPKSPYRLQIGYGGNNGDSGCAFAMSTWFEINEGGTTLNADIYAFLDETCYYPPETCSNGLDDDGDGAIDTDDPDCFTCSSGLLSNPDFSSDLTSWTDWGNTTLQTETNGNKYARISGGQGGFGQDVATTAGTTFTLNFLGKKTGTENASAGFAFYDASWTKLGGDHSVQVTSASFQQYSVTFTAPVNTAWVQSWGWKEAGSGTLDLDGFCLTANVTEICNNGIDDDGDGLIDCDDPDCDRIDLSNVAVSNCIDHPLQDVATVSVDVSWVNAPSNDTIEVNISGKTEYIDVAGGIISPQTITFIVPADASTGNTITANWGVNNTLCSESTTYDAPAACSNDIISCKILYLCGEDKPENGYAWDHGWLEYLDAVNGSNSITPILTKPDATGMGTYDPMNPATPVVINLNDYGLIIVSATTENYIATDLVTSLKDVSGSLLNSNINLANDFGMSATEAGPAWQDYAYIDNTTSEVLYDYNNKISPWDGLLFLEADYYPVADAYLWENAGDQAAGVKGIYFVYEASDVLPGIAAGHGKRVHFGYHMNGVYANNENGGAIPLSDSLWFDPVKHLTLVGKTYFDSALVLAAANCATLTCTGTMTTPCYDNSTGTVTDDRYWPAIDLSADTDNWSYAANDNQGNSWTHGASGGSLPHSYYRTDTFPVIINITGGQNGCTQTFTITDPPSCSVACDSLAFTEVTTICVNDSMATTINITNSDNTCWEAIRKIDGPDDPSNPNVVFLMSGQGDGSFTLPLVSISDIQATPTPTNYTLWVHSVDCMDSTIVFHDCVHDVVINVPNCVEICNNCIDDDGDGLTDCADSDCNCTLPVLEFCIYNLKLNYNETFNIRDFVHVLDETMTVDWSQVYFTYTAAGANNPASPSDWHLSDFNNGSNVTVTSADDDPGTGNSGDGRYRIYLVRNGQSTYDDHMNIEVEDGSSNSSESKCLIEICGNLCDDDGDGLIDGADPDCGCNNFVDAGTIIGDESNCDSYDPSLITEVTSPSGGLGVVQYQWQYENGSGWANLIGTDSATYNPMTITVTTQYRRGARRSPCTTWFYSNIVTKTVTICPEICNNGIDDDEDGLIDCADPGCQLTIITELSFSNCALAGNEYQATLSVVVEWTNPPVGENINVTANSSTQIIDIVGGATSPDTVQFTITADNSQNNPILLTYSGGGGCADSTNYNSPAPCCLATLAVNDSISLCPGLDYIGSVAQNDSNLNNKTFSVLTQASFGTAVIQANGGFTYTSTTTICGIDEFTYQVCDPANICCTTALVHLSFSDNTIPTLLYVPDNDTIICDEEIPLPPQIFALDNCPEIALTVNEESTQGEDGCSLYDYTITRTWTATDQCGNSTSDSQVVDIQDVVAPDIFRIYTLPNGKKMAAGVMEFVGKNWKTVNLPIDFDTKPIIIHQVITANDATPIASQIRNTSVSQFELRIQEEEGNDNVHTRESVAWVAMEAGVQSADYQLEMESILLSGVPKALTFQNAFAGVPALFTSTQSTNESDAFAIRNDVLTNAGMTLNIQEEASDDVEIIHANETVGYLAIENTGELREEKGILMGEVGTMALNNTWTTVILNNDYQNPVIIASSLSNIDGEPATVRVRNVSYNSFQVSIEEWEYLDGNHGNETVSYMVIEGSVPLESPEFCDTGTDSLEIGIDFRAIDNCDKSVVINYSEITVFFGAKKITIRSWSAEDECGNSNSYSQQITCEGVSLRIKSVLQGAMLGNNNDGLMRDDLRKKGLLPFEEPYSKMDAFQHIGGGGGEIVDTSLFQIEGANGIVDWIFIELRDPNDIENVVATCSGLIQCDGDLVSIGGDTIIHFTNIPVGDYFVAVRHRNHLGMVSLNPYTFSPTQIPFVDFTYNFTPVVGSHSSIEIDDQQTMWSGDLNNDGKIIYQGPNNDVFHMFLEILLDEENTDFLTNFISRGYTPNDFNLDGTIIYQGPNNDRANLLFNTILIHPQNSQKFSNFIIHID